MSRGALIAFLRLAALAGLAALVWLAATGNWTARDWQTPAAYSVDALETLGRFRVAEERGVALLWDPTVPRLGAPGAADWSAYPLPDAPWYWLAGRLTGWLGLIAASNAMLLLAHVAAVLSFFGCARFLGHRVWPAAGAALLFGFSFSIAYRGLSHHSFALAFTVPPALLAVWLVAGSRRLIASPRGRAFAIGAGVLTGLGNPYFIYLFGLLLGGAVAVQLLGARRRANVRTGVLAGGGCLLAFALTNGPFLHATLTASAADLFARNAAATTLYGLRWSDLLVPPPTHRADFAAALGQAHAQRAEGELFAPYLGIVGATALVLMAGLTVQRLLRRRRRPFRPAHAAWAVAILALALVGGLNHWLAQAGFDYFRASNRYSIHLLAIALFALSAWASRRLRTVNPAKAAFAVMAVTALGLWDQTPRPLGAEHRQQLRDLVNSDRAVAGRLEAALPFGAAVFQLPVAHFPEQGPIGRMLDYEWLRPYLFTTQVRFSYGGLRSSELLPWQRNVAALPAAAMVRELERAGFAALAVRTDALPDGAAGLQAHLPAAGRTVLLHERELVVFRLQPTGPLRPPAADDPLRFPAWDGLPPPSDRPAVLLGAGWHDLERDGARAWRWALPRATLLLANPTGAPLRVRLTAQLVTLAPATVTWQLGATSGRIARPDNADPAIALEFTLAPGIHPLELQADVPARRAGPQDPRAIAFQLADVGLGPVAPDAR